MIKAIVALCATVSAQRIEITAVPKYNNVLRKKVGLATERRANTIHATAIRMLTPT